MPASRIQLADRSAARRCSCDRNSRIRRPVSEEIGASALIMASAREPSALGSGWVVIVGPCRSAEPLDDDERLDRRRQIDQRVAQDRQQCRTAAPAQPAEYQAEQEDLPDAEPIILDMH